MAAVDVIPRDLAQIFMPRVLIDSLSDLLPPDRVVVFTDTLLDLNRNAHASSLPLASASRADQSISSPSMALSVRS